MQDTPLGCPILASSWAWGVLRGVFGTGAGPRWAAAWKSARAEQCQKNFLLSFPFPPVRGADGQEVPSGFPSSLIELLGAGGPQERDN